MPDSQPGRATAVLATADQIHDYVETRLPASADEAECITLERELTAELDLPVTVVAPRAGGLLSSIELADGSTVSVRKHPRGEVRHGLRPCGASRDAILATAPRTIRRAINRDRAHGRRRRLSARLPARRLPRPCSARSRRVPSPARGPRASRAGPDDGDPPPPPKRGHGSGGAP